MRCLRLITAAALALVVSGCTMLGKLKQVVMDPSVPVGLPGQQPTQVAFSFYASTTLNSNPNSLDSTQAPGGLAPDPYSVSLSASTPEGLTEKVGELLEHLHARFPAMSPSTQQPPAPLAHSPLLPRTPGDYSDPQVNLALPASLVPPAQVATPVAIKVLQLRDDTVLLNALYLPLQQNPAKALRSTYVRDDDYLLAPGEFKFVPFEPLEPETRFIAVIADYSHTPGATWRQVLPVPPRGHQVVFGVQVGEQQLLLEHSTR